MRRKPPKAEHACARCKNEEDLRAWNDGCVYCPSCLNCGCEGPDDHVNGVCLWCLRKLHTVMTFRGPRIKRLSVYIIDARDSYLIRPYQLLTWTFQEEEDAQLLYDATYRPPHSPHRAAPPHHRFG